MTPIQHKPTIRYTTGNLFDLHLLATWEPMDDELLIPDDDSP